MNKALLLIVDVQKGFLQTAETRAVVPCINELVTAWQERSWPVAYSRFINLENSNWQRLRDWHELTDEPATQLADGLIVTGNYIFKKSTYAAWSPETAAVCAGQGITDVVIAGVDTNECVLATALAVFDAGLTPWVAENCCASNGGSKPHAAAIGLLKPLLGEQQIVKSSQLL